MLAKTQKFSDRLANLGFSQESLKMAEGMLVELPDWNQQFETGKTGAKVVRENKTTLAVGLPNMDIDNRAGKQKGHQGKHRRVDSRSLSAVAIPKGNPQQGPRSRSDLVGLRMFEEKPQDCRPRPEPRSPEQKQATQQAQQAAQQQGQTFDTMPPQQQQQAAQQGGEAPREKKPPLCPK